MTSGQCKEFIASWCRGNKEYLVKKWKQRPPPPTDADLEKSIYKPKNWKRASKSIAEDGRVIRVFHGCAGGWYDANGVGYPRLLIATLTEEDGEVTGIKIRKY